MRIIGLYEKVANMGGKLEVKESEFKLEAARS
jgi:hypothetical protein